MELPMIVDIYCKVFNFSLTKIMKVDFSKVSINATVEGDPVVIDLTKEVGNLVYGRTADIAVSDFGKKIYYSKEAIDVPRPMAESIKEIIMGSSFIAPLKNAMNELLTPKTKKNGNNDNQ